MPSVAARIHFQQQEIEEDKRHKPKKIRVIEMPDNLYVVVDKGDNPLISLTVFNTEGFSNADILTIVESILDRRRDV